VVGLDDGRGMNSNADLLKARTMDRAGLTFSYAKSLLWVAAFAALAVSAILITQLIFIDFVHGNPDRTKSNAIFMMAAFPPILGFLSVLGVLLVFGLAQFVHGVTTYILAPRFGLYSHLFFGLMLPLISIVTWFCFDYLVPSDFNLAINEGPDWTPYQHGMTFQRYLTVLAIQASVTAFTIIYCIAPIRNFSKRRIILGAVVLISVAGTILGYHGAAKQYRFIDHPGSGSMD